MKIDLKGQIAIVTGASSGIGKTIAIKLAESGANVALMSRNKEALLKVSEEIKGLGRNAWILQTDITNFSEVHKNIEEFVSENKRIDILINNAGISEAAMLWKMTEEQWDRVIAVNLKGCFNCLHAVAPIFKNQNYGKVVNISSINAFRGKMGLINYSAAKAGIIGLTKTAAIELAKFNVNVNVVAPGMIETPMVSELPQEILERARNESLFKRLGTTEDVAYLVVFLCSEYAKHITGAVIPVDGGQYLSSIF